MEKGIKKHKKINPERLKITPKFELWLRHFLNIRNKKTFGNATQSALLAYNTTNLKTAGIIGHENIVKMKALRGMLAEKMGYDFGKLFQIGIKKMKSGNFEDWDRLMVRLGYFEPLPKDGVVFNQAIQISGVVKEDKNKYGS